MEDFDERSKRFVDWFCSHPKAFLHENVELADLRFRSAGRGLVATSDIPAETAIFTIPRNCVITVENSQLTTIQPELFDLETRESDTETNGDASQTTANMDDGEDEIPRSWISLILVMIYEYLQGERSKWKPYMDLLPEDLDTPMFWADDEIDRLEGSNLKNRIGRTAAERMFRMRVIPRITSNTDTFYPPTMPMLGNRELIDLAHRMGSTIMAYAFDLDKEEEESYNDGFNDEALELRGSETLGGTPSSMGTSASERPHVLAKANASGDMGSEIGSAGSFEAADDWIEAFGDDPTLGMVPMADMLNADAEFNARLEHEEESLTMVSIRPITAGEEILNYYGPLSNAELLRRYGYTTPKHARYDVVEVQLEELLKAFHEPDARMQALSGKVEDLGLTVSSTFLLERNAGHPDDTGQFCVKPEIADLSEDMKEYLEVLSCLIRGISVNRWRSDNLSLHENEELQWNMVNVMRRVLESRMASYSTSVERDEEVLKGAISNGSTRLANAVQVRLGEKRVIQEATGRLEEKRKALETSMAGGRGLDDSEVPNRKRLKLAS